MAGKGSDGRLSNQPERKCSRCGGDIISESNAQAVNRREVDKRIYEVEKAIAELKVYTPCERPGELNPLSRKHRYVELIDLALVMINCAREEIF